MNNYENIAVIVVRGFATSFLVSAMIEVGIIASDFMFVKTGVYDRSEIALRPRLILLAFYFLASMFLFTQSRMIAAKLIQGLVSREDKEIIDDETVQSDSETKEN